jgi:integrase
LAVLRRVANLAYRRWGWLSEPIGAKIELLPENPARERFLDRSELAKLLRGIPNRSMRKAALVAAFTGLRRGELAKLRPVNVQGDLIYLKTTKSGRPRTVPVVHHVLFALRRLPFGVHADTLTHAVQRSMPGLRFHDLRHTAASFLIASGVDLYRVGAILGHSDQRTTKRYAHLAVADLRSAVATLGRGSAQGLHREKIRKAVND